MLPRLIGALSSPIHSTRVRRNDAPSNTLAVWSAIVIRDKKLRTKQKN